MKQKLLCVIGWHAFSKWTDGNVYKMRVKNDDCAAGVLDGHPYWIEKGEVVTQTRVCTHCGLKASRTVEL
jgi:hypothetical protein